MPGKYDVVLKGVADGTYILYVADYVAGRPVNNLEILKIEQPISEDKVVVEPFDLPRLGGLPEFWLGVPPVLIPEQSLLKRALDGLI